MRLYKKYLKITLSRCVCWCVRLVMVEREQRKNMEALLNIVLKPIEWFFPTLMTVPVSIVARAMLNKTLMPVIDKVEIIGNSDMHVVATN